MNPTNDPANDPANDLRRNKLHFLKLSHIQPTGNVEEMIDIAILHGYRDMCRTLRGISSYQDREVCKASAIAYLKKEMNRFLDGKVRDFAQWHKEITLRLITVFAFQPFTVGQSQKWINMTLKYLYCLITVASPHTESLFQACHIPIDRIVIHNANKQYGVQLHIPWSKISDYDCYLHFQHELRKYALEKHVSLLQLDFALWHDGQMEQE